jgi:hypothetical protein
MWFARANGRDITAAVYSYHEHPELSLQILKKYETNVPPSDVLDPTLNVPKYVLPDNFNAATDLVHFDFHFQNNFLQRVRRRIDTPEMKKKIRAADNLFDFVSFLILLFHIYL